jgi:HK97 family phage major capsid protein
MELNEMLEKRAQLVKGIADAKTSEELDTMELDLRKLDMQITEARAADEAKKNEKTPEELEAEQRSHAIPAAAKKGAEEKTPEKKGIDLEKIAASLRNNEEVRINAEVMKEVEKRAIASSSTVIPAYTDSLVHAAPNGVAAAVDLVHSFPLTGGNKWSVGFEVSDGEGDYTAEGAAYTNNEPTFDTNETAAIKITNSVYVDEEVVDLPAADYILAVVQAAQRSVRKKVSKQIVAGTGTKSLLGIANSPAKVMPTDYKVELSAFDKDSLRKIIMAFGGDEDIASPMTLFLNKATLDAFLAVELKSGDPAYTATFNGTGGTIKEAKGGLEVPYSLNSALPAFGTAAAGNTFAVYGDPMAYDLPIFGDLTITQNPYIKEDNGQVAFFAKMYVGGVVNAYKAFLPVKKKSA